MLYSGYGVEAFELSGIGDIQVPVATPTLFNTFVILPKKEYSFFYTSLFLLLQPVSEKKTP